MKLLNPSLSFLLAIVLFVPIVLFAILALIFRSIRAFVDEEDGTRLLRLDDFEKELAGWE